MFQKRSFAVDDSRRADCTGRNEVTFEVDTYCACQARRTNVMEAVLLVQRLYGETLHYCTRMSRGRNCAISDKCEGER